MLKFNETSFCKTIISRFFVLAFSFYSLGIKTKHTYSGKSLSVATLDQEGGVVTDDQPLQVRRHFLCA
jgi:hypothetical protein